MGESPRAAPMASACAEVSTGVPAAVAEDPFKYVFGSRTDSLVGVEAGSVEFAHMANEPLETIYRVRGGTSGRGDASILFSASASLSLLSGGAERSYSLKVRYVPRGCSRSLLLSV